MTFIYFIRINSCIHRLFQEKFYFKNFYTKCYAFLFYYLQISKNFLIYISCTIAKTFLWCVYLKSSWIKYVNNSPKIKESIQVLEQELFFSIQLQLKLQGFESNSSFVFWRTWAIDYNRYSSFYNSFMIVLPVVVN